MLALTRKAGERVFIGDDIIVTVIAINGNRVKIGVEAPHRIPVHREEVYKSIQTHGKQKYVRTNG